MTLWFLCANNSDPSNLAVQMLDTSGQTIGTRAPLTTSFLPQSSWVQLSFSASDLGVAFASVGGISIQEVGGSQTPNTVRFDDIQLSLAGPPPVPATTPRAVCIASVLLAGLGLAALRRSSGVQVEVRSPSLGVGARQSLDGD